MTNTQLFEAWQLNQPGFGPLHLRLASTQPAVYSCPIVQHNWQIWQAAVSATNFLNKDRT